MEHVPTPDGVAGDHGHHRLGAPADLHLEVQDVEAPDPRLADLVVAQVAVVAPDLLVAPGAEGVGALAGEDHHPYVRIILGSTEGGPQLADGPGPEGVAHLGTVDGDLGHPLGRLVADVDPAP